MLRMRFGRRVKARFKPSTRFTGWVASCSILSLYSRPSSVPTSTTLCLPLHCPWATASALKGKGETQWRVGGEERNTKSSKMIIHRQNWKSTHQTRSKDVTTMTLVSTCMMQKLFASPTAEKAKPASVPCVRKGWAQNTNQASAARSLKNP